MTYKEEFNSLREKISDLENEMDAYHKALKKLPHITFGEQGIMLSFRERNPASMLYYRVLKWTDKVRLFEYPKSSKYVVVIGYMEGEGIAEKAGRHKED